MLLDTSLLIFTYSPLKEVCLSLKRDHVHPFERIFNIVLLRNTELEKETIGDELNVLVHQSTVHSDQLDWERLSDEVRLDLNSLSNNLEDSLICEFIGDVLVEQTGKVCVHAFIS